jgi:hypothetical protein
VALIRTTTKRIKGACILGATTNNEAAEAFATDVPPAVSSTPSGEASVSSQFTAEDISRAREQEKQKVYSTMEKMKEELSGLKKEREEREALEADRRAKRVERDTELAKKKQEETDAELGFKELLQKKELELESKLAEQKAATDNAFALLARERDYQELQTYRSQRLEQERENIIPELIDLIQGNNAEEVEASIVSLKEKSTRIFDNVAAASQQSRKEMVGARITAPANGPLDNDSDSQSASPDELRNMSMADYAKNRSKLLGASGTNRGQGLFG